VWQVAWAHPKFGSYLASGSYDGSVIVWKEEQQGGRSLKPASTSSNTAATLWTKAKVHRFHEASGT
jgi:protein transport protein SEC13